MRAIDDAAFNRLYKIARLHERDPTYAKASSALSASSIRQQFSTPANITLSQRSFEFLRRAHETLVVPAEAPPLLSLEERGYLYVAIEQSIATLRENHAVQIANGADISWFDRAQLATKFPWLACDDIVAGTWGASGKGWFDGPALLQAFWRKAIRSMYATRMMNYYVFSSIRYRPI